MTETKIVITFTATIQEKWTTDLTDSSSNYYVALAETYIQFFMEILKSISTDDVPSTTAISFWTCRVSSFTQSSSPRRKRNTDSEKYIVADFEVIYDILADADSSSTSGISTSIESAIISEIEFWVETVLQELVKLTQQENHTVEDTNFITKPEVTKTEFENLISSEVSLMYINIVYITYKLTIIF